MRSYWHHFSSEQGQYVIVTMEFKVPKRHIWRPALSIDMVQHVLRWERQNICSSGIRQGPMAEECCYNSFIRKCNFGEEKTETREDKRMVQPFFFLFFFSKTALFAHTLKTLSTLNFGSWSFLSIYIWFTPSEGPKGFLNLFFKKSDHGCWTMEKDHLPWSDFMVHGVNQPLYKVELCVMVWHHINMIWIWFPKRFADP